MRGILFVFLWYSSIMWSVYFMYCPLVPLMFLNRSIFRKLMDIVLSCWEMYPACLLQLLIGCKVHICGDAMLPNEGSILIMNHRNRLDWFFLWAALLRGTKPPAHRTKFVLKSDVKFLPGIGWGLQLAGFLFIYRNWTKDQELLRRSLDYFKDLNAKYQILIFAEGTDLSPSSKQKSHAFALKNGLKAYEYVLHPRTTGFTYLAKQMKQNKQLDSVYDVTIAYPKVLPESEMDILKGKFPEEVHFNIKRYDAAGLPNDEPNLKVWCEKRWEEKEVALEKFYGAQPPNKREFIKNSKSEVPWNVHYFVLAFWSFFGVVIGPYLFWTSTIAFYWVISWTIFFILVSIFTDGIQQLEISLHNHDKEADKYKDN